jgi:ABC-2 type transport system permease protein
VTTQTLAPHGRASWLNGLGQTVRESFALSRRAVLGTIRLPQAWFPSLFFPLVLMAIFSGSFGQAPGNIPGFPEVASFLDFAVAGAVIQGILIGGTTAGSAFAIDMERGFFDRLVASPASRSSIVTGRVMGSVALGVVGAVIFMGIAAIFGARVAAGFVGVLLVLLMAGILAGAVGGLGVYLALRTRSSEAVQGTFPLFFALLFFSSAFFPRETMDGWFRVVADLNPISYLAEGMRAPIVEGLDWAPILIGFGIAIGLAAIALAAAGMAFRRRLGTG